MVMCEKFHVELVEMSWTTDFFADVCKFNEYWMFQLMDFQRTFQTGFLFSALTPKNKKPDYFSDSPTSGFMFLEESVGRRERNIFSMAAFLDRRVGRATRTEHIFDGRLNNGS